MEFFFFARFQVRAGSEIAAIEALRTVLAPTRAEPGCIGINAFRSKQDPRIFLIHSRWSDEAAFELHARLPHTVNFIRQMESLVDRPPEFTRTEMIG